MISEQKYGFNFLKYLTEFITAPGIPAENGDKWLFNAYRINNTSRDDIEYLAWSPTGKVNFHISNYFGELEFVNACPK